MAPKYKLTYFNARGHAELIRLIFAQAGVDYDDVRIEKDKWPAIKESFPFGKVPVLEFDGHALAESRSIARYLAKEFGLAGKNNWEYAYCDMLIDGCYDFLKELLGIRHEADEAKKAERLKKFATEILPPAFDHYQKLLQKNNGGKGFFVGDSITWADIGLANALYAMVNRKADILEKHPLLKEFMDRVMSQPNIKAWVEKRPKTDL